LPSEVPGRASWTSSRIPSDATSEKSIRAVDTNVLVRLITRDDREQVAAAEAFVKKGAWVSHLVLAETTWVLISAYDLEHEQVATAVEMLLHHEEITVQDADVVSAALEHYRKRPALGFSDSLVLEIARKAGHMPLGTFDRNLGKLDGAERL
jgi:predicted nucleic-acid-binding protein